MGRTASLLDFKQQNLCTLPRIVNVHLDFNVKGQWLREEGTLTQEEGQCVCLMVLAKCPSSPLPQLIRSPIFYPLYPQLSGHVP
jgi:hypothetical protein